MIEAFGSGASEGVSLVDRLSLVAVCGVLQRDVNFGDFGHNAPSDASTGGARACWNEIRFNGVSVARSHRATAQTEQSMLMKMIKFVASMLPCVGALVFFTGCASVMVGTRQSVALDSKPSGAEVLVYNSHGEVVYQGTTPCAPKLDRTAPDSARPNYVVLIRKEGYTPVQLPLKSEVNRAYLANIVFGGVGLAIDPATGAMWTLTTSDADQKLLSPNRTAFLEQDHSLVVKLSEEKPADLTAHAETNAQ